MVSPSHARSLHSPAGTHYNPTKLEKGECHRISAVAPGLGGGLKRALVYKPYARCVSEITDSSSGLVAKSRQPYHGFVPPYGGRRQGRLETPSGKGLAPSAFPSGASRFLWRTLPLITGAMTIPIHLSLRNSTSPGSKRRRSASYGLKSLYISLSMRSRQPLLGRCESCSTQLVPQNDRSRGHQRDATARRYANGGHA